MSIKKELLIGLLIVIPMLLIIFITTIEQNKDTSGMDQMEVTIDYTKVNQPNKTSYSAEEVSNHNIEEDCWVIVNSKVYDVTGFPEEHPGGAERILNSCGKDVTQDFETKGGEGEHSDNAKEILEGFYIGELNE